MRLIDADALKKAIIKHLCVKSEQYLLPAEKSIYDLIDKQPNVDMPKEQEPKPPIHIHEEYPKHDWETDENGNIDEWAMSYEIHNGPACERCGYSFCLHCKPNGWNEEPCVIDYYQCPKCSERIYKGGKNIEYCVNCGQAVKWE